ncbi:fibronectin type III domain-containing protein [Paenibacillus wulumuqiensis]|uniref:fibronectin type III domain-containing protein n=1 Tax=Paenibacillus wulumuqiensis TaxID=1567107 RepID=UPI0006962011|nr:fibronectin type III domain-containing protein [Paenibacillus wulumuqiensis]
MTTRSKGFKWYMCCCMLLVLLLPAAGRSNADTIEDMQGSTLPAGTIYTASGTQGVTFEPENIGDGNWYSIWKLNARYARLQVVFPEAVNMKAVQLSTGSIGKRYETYTVEGLQDGKWSRLGKKTYKLDPQDYVALDPIPVPAGWYDGIRITAQSTRPYLLISELQYISDLNSPSGLKTTYGNQQLHLTWQPVSGASGYRVRYGPESGVYTQTLDVAADMYSGLTIPNLNNRQTYYFTVAALDGGSRSNYSNEVLNIPVDGFDFPSYMTAGSNGEWYRHPVINTRDHNMSTMWRHNGNDPQGELYYEFFYPLYVSELQLIVSAAEDSDLTYTIFKGRGSSEQVLAQRQIHLEGAKSPVALEPFPVAPGWYTDISVRIESSTAPIFVNEVRYNTDHTPVQNVKATSGNAQLLLTWDKVAEADQYRITYGNEYGDIAQTEMVTVSEDAYAGYTLTGLINNGSPYYVLVQAVVNGEDYGYSEVAVATPRSYSTGDFLPLDTKVTASGSFDNALPDYAADRNLRQGWVPESGEHKNGTINFAFSQPIDIHAVQPVATVHPPAVQHYIIYGLKGRDWILLYDGQVQVPYNPAGGVLEPIPVTPGKYEGLMLVIDASPNWVVLQELLVFYNQPGSSVLADTYGERAVPTVSDNTYQ